MRFKRTVFALFGVAAAIFSFLVYKQGQPEFQHLDFRLKDARFRIRGPVKPDPNIVVVAIDHKSITELGRWPWSREKTAALIDTLGSYYDTKVTALDIVFSEPQETIADQALAAAVARAGNVVMGFFFRDEATVPEQDSLSQLEGKKLKLIRVAEGVQHVPVQEYAGLDLNIPLVGRSALDFGFFNARPDPDGLYRRSILLLMYNGDMYPSLAMKALRHYLGGEIMLDVKPWGVDSLQIGSLRVPSREDGTMALNFYGPSGSFTTVSAADVVAKRVPPDLLARKIAFVGATEIGIYDLRPTPFDATLPGVEIHATMAANALERRFLRYDGITQQYELACILAVPALLGLLLAFVPGTLAGLGLTAATTGLFAAFNYVMFDRFYRDMTVIHPLFGILLTYVGCEVWRNLVVERRGKQLKKAFSSYVSPDLVKLIEKNPEKLVLGGEQREITVLFSDIRGFTTLSENLSPTELVTLLNEYLSPMTRIVLEERGTLDKFIGDAVMALFNAPLDLPDHAERACRAATRMLEVLRELNGSFRLRGMPPIDIGIGINTGPAVVGNMGADLRFDYTAIGDSVNLASRLEGLNKQYGSRILVSEDTRRQVRDDALLFREVDRVRVKGKHQPVVMYELMVENREIISRFENALLHYHERDFGAAEAVFSDLFRTTGDGPSRMYAERCREHLDAPPPEGWDGVYVATTK